MAAFVDSEGCLDYPALTCPIVGVDPADSGCGLDIGDQQFPNGNRKNELLMTKSYTQFSGTSRTASVVVTDAISTDSSVDTLRRSYPNVFLRHWCLTAPSGSANSICDTKW
ncbi:hypothetical protein FRC02_007560 [Tulasnella sp. 418]|nr:hypothetical protein FRC02_007560 [Tulasnella sp. 418]